MDVLKDRVEKIIKAGANVVITTKGVDDLAAKYFVENNILAFRRIDKSDLRRIAKACGASVVTTMAQGDGEELFESSWLGEAGEVYEEPVGDWDYFFIEVQNLLAFNPLGFHQAKCLHHFIERCQRLHD
jgi:T-complex protein 1 subunit alpha